MTAETLGDLLAENNLRPKHYRAGSSHRLKCPSCNARDEDSFSLVIDADGLGFTGNCHRGKCGHTVGAKLKPAGGMPYQRKEQFRPPASHAPEVTEPGFDVYSWFGRRGINADTVDMFGVYSMPHKFYDKVVHDSVVFPYVFKGKVVNRKYRGFDNKGLMGQEYQPLPTLFNIDAVTEPDEIVWVEGECDVMAVHQAGYPQVVSLKDGAPTKESEEGETGGKRFEALSTHHEVLAKVKKFVLAGDMDGPGEILKRELARRLGRNKCWLVLWPNGYKDANETLLKAGEAAVQDAIANAQPYPIEGIQRTFKGSISAYLRLPPPPVMKTGIGSVDEVLKIPGEGRVIVTTGVPNSGKTQFGMNVMVNLMREYGRRFCVFSPEYQPFDEFAVAVSQMVVGKPARRPVRGAYTHLMTVQEQDAAAEWLSERLFFISPEDDEKGPTLTWILETAKECVLRHGVTDLWIDPFNEIELDLGGKSETQYIGWCLQRSRAFGHRYGCNVWINAHPTKMQPAKPGEAVGPPGPYDISGSAHWANKPDIGITIHTPGDITGMTLWKSRFSRWGRKGATAQMEFDEATGIYHSPGVEVNQIRLPYADN